jgi:hypothetical protein
VYRRQYADGLTIVPGSAKAVPDDHEVLNGSG